jgi:hypothetical protein
VLELWLAPTDLYIVSRNVKDKAPLLYLNHSGSAVWFIIRAVVSVFSSQDAEQEPRGLSDPDSNESVGLQKETGAAHEQE